MERAHLAPPYLERGWPGCHELCPFSVPAAEGSPAAGSPSPLHVPLFVTCLVLAVLLLLTVLAFTAALLRTRKMSGKDPPWAQRGRLCHGAAEWAHPPLVPTAHAMSSLGLAGPVLVTHSAQSPTVLSGTSNDYREMPPSLPKGSGRSGGSPARPGGCGAGGHGWQQPPCPHLVPQTHRSQPCPPPRTPIPTLTTNTTTSAASRPWPSPPSTVSTPPGPGTPATQPWDPRHPALGFPGVPH